MFTFNDIEKNITILIPSKVIDKNLKNCVAKIRKFYKKIKILLVLDTNSKFKFDKNVIILTSGPKTIGYKRNLAIKYVDTKYICFIDSDAYPKNAWLNKSLKLLNQKNIGAIGGPNLSPKTKDIEKILVARSRRNSIVTLNPKVKSDKTKEHIISFLPSCNLIVKKNLFKKIKGMDNRLYSGEEISLNYNIKKLGYKMKFSPSIKVYHIDRNFKHFARQRFIYGSTGLWYALNYPCKESFLLLISSFPILFLLSFPVIFINNALKLSFFFGIIVLMNLLILNSIKINFKNNFLKSLKLSIISIFFPGLGLLARNFLSNKRFQKLYTQM